MSKEPLGLQILKALKIDPKNVVEVRLTMKADGADTIEIVRHIVGTEHDGILSVIDRHEVRSKG